MEEKDTDNLDLIFNCIYNNPLPLLKIEDEDIIKYINNFLPYSIGMEFECVKKKNYDINKFKNIPDILDVDVDDFEQRYRIPSGLKGMICLYHICNELKSNSIVDLESSNHFHFDFTDVDRDAINTAENREYIINELIKWETAKDLTMKSSWIRFFNTLGTLEIRIGEPTFEYSLIINRLIQGSNISKYLKGEISIDIKIALLRNKLSQLNINGNKLQTDKYKEIIDNKVIKMY